MYLNKEKKQNETKGGKRGEPPLPVIAFFVQLDDMDSIWVLGLSIGYNFFKHNF